MIFPLWALALGERPHETAIERRLDKAIARLDTLQRQRTAEAASAGQSAGA